MTAVICAILEYKDKEYKVFNTRSCIKDEIYNKIDSIKGQCKDFPKQFIIKRYSKKLDKYITTELRDVQNYDRFLIEESIPNIYQKNLGIPKGESSLPSTILTNTQRIIMKLKGNERLTGIERSFICNQLEVICQKHPENEMDTEQKDATISKKRKYLDKDIVQKKIMINKCIQVNSIEKKSKLEIIYQKHPEDGMDTEHNDATISKKRKYIDKDIVQKNTMIDKYIQVNLIEKKSIALKDNVVQCEKMMDDYSRYDKLLNEQYKKKGEDRDLEKIQRLSYLTFPIRRCNFVLSPNPINAKMAKEIYPFLFNSDQVCLEFEHITRKKALFNQFKENVKNLRAGILRFSEDPFKDEIEESIENEHYEEIKLKMKIAASLLLLPSYLNDDLREVIIFKNEELTEDHNCRPFIKCKNSKRKLSKILKGRTEFEIHVDEEKLCVTRDIVNAYYALVAAYYIFNAEYPKRSRDTFYFLEYYCLNFYSDNRENPEFYISYDNSENYEFSPGIKKKIELLLKYSKRTNFSLT